MWKLLLLTPPVAAIIWAMFRIKGFKARDRKALLVGIGITTFTYFIIQDYIDIYGVYPFHGAKIIHDTAAALILPMVHLFFCYSLGITKSLNVFKALCCITILLLPDYIHFLCTFADGDPLMRNEIFNYAQISLSRNLSFRLQNYSIIILLQILIEAQRITVLRRIFMYRNLYLTHSAKALIYLALFTCLVVIVSVIPPHSFFANPVVNIATLCLYSCLFTTVTIGFSSFFNKDVVMDSDHKPVDINNDHESELGKSIRLLYERDNIHLNSNLKVEDIANMLATNRTYVTRAFRFEYQATFTEVTNSYRLEYAKNLMATDPKMRIEDVAQKSGFASANFFGRVFRTHEKMTPSQWRAEERKNAADALPSPLNAQSKTKPIPTDGMTTDEALGIKPIEEAKKTESEKTFSGTDDEGIYPPPETTINALDDSGLDSCQSAE